MPIRFLLPPALGLLKASARAELLAEALTSELDDLVTVQVAKTYDELAQRALGGDVDIVWAPSGVCPVLTPCVRAMWRVVRSGASTYRSALVCRRRDRVSIDSLHEALRGRGKRLRAAWVDPLSVGGYLLVADKLRQIGLEPSRVFASEHFYGSHPDALGAVIGGSADVSALTVAGGDIRDVHAAFTMHVGLYARELAVVLSTEEAPTDAIVVTRAMSEAQLAPIEARLFTMAPPRSPTFLLAAMDAEAFVATRPSDYELVRKLTQR